MKSMKVAAALAGSLAVVGAAAPAFASADITPPMSLNGGLDAIAQNVANAPVVDAQPIGTNLLDPRSEESPSQPAAAPAKDAGKAKGVKTKVAKAKGVAKPKGAVKTKDAAKPKDAEKAKDLDKAKEADTTEEPAPNPGLLLGGLPIG